MVALWNIDSLVLLNLFHFTYEVPTVNVNFQLLEHICESNNKPASVFRFVESDLYLLTLVVLFVIICKIDYFDIIKVNDDSIQNLWKVHYILPVILIMELITWNDVKLPFKHMFPLVVYQSHSWPVVHGSLVSGFVSLYRLLRFCVLLTLEDNHKAHSFHHVWLAKIHVPVWPIYLKRYCPGKIISIHGLWCIL